MVSVSSSTGNKSYSVNSAFGMAILAQKKVEVGITDDGIAIESKQNIDESVGTPLSDVVSVSRTFFLSPINMVLMLLVTGLSAFSCQFFQMFYATFAVMIVLAVIVVVIGMNFRTQLVLTNGRIVNIDSWSPKLAGEIYRDIMGRSACTAKKAGKVYVLHVIALLFSVVFIGISAYFCFIPDKYVQVVKDSEATEYATGITYGEAFSDYFKNAQWISYDTKDGGKVVEFSGRCTIDDTESEVVIQYVIDGSSYEFVYYEVNGTAGTLSGFEELMQSVFGE